MKKIYLLFICASLHAQPNPALEVLYQKKEAPLALDAAVEQALKQRPSIQALGQQVAALGYRARKQLSDYAPQLSVTAGINNAAGLGGDNTPTTFTLNGSQLIYNFASPFDRYKFFREEEYAVAELQAALKDVVRFEVETTFLNTWLLQQKEILIHSLAKTARITFEQAKDRYKVSTTSINQFLNAETNYSRDFTSIKDYAEDVYSAYAELSYRMGTQIKPNIPLAWNPNTAIKMPQLATCIDAALSNRKELKSKVHRIKGARERYSYSLKNYLPSFSVFGNVAYQGGLEGGPSTVKTGGAQLSWNLFDGLGNYFEAQNAHANMLEEQFEQTEIKNQIRSQVTQARNNLIKAMSNLETVTVAYREARSVFVQKDQEAKLGLLAFAEFQQAALAWHQARFNWLTSRIAVEIKARELQFACGYPPQL